MERGQVICKPGSLTPHIKFECELYVLRQDEGGRHTPFFNNYRPQFFFRTADITGSVTLPAGKEMVMPGDNVTCTVEIIHPIREPHAALDPEPRGQHRAQPHSPSHALVCSVRGGPAVRCARGREDGRRGHRLQDPAVNFRAEVGPRAFLRVAPALSGSPPPRSALLSRGPTVESDHVPSSSCCSDSALAG